jgi:hypothetical protein
MSSERGAGAAKETRNRLVVVLGMHRSGTSAIARGLAALGVDLGERLMPPAPGNNEKGFFEDIDANALNNDLLAALGRSWDTVTALRPEDLEKVDLGPFRLRAVDLLRDRTAGKPVFGLKDPRISLVMPFWKSVFAHLGLDTSYVMCARHPLSVARSLHRRDGMELEKSLYLWLDHVTCAMLGSEGEPRVVVEYDRLMSDPQGELARMARGLALPYDAQGAGVAEFTRDFLSEDLRHSRYQPGDLLLSPEVPGDVVEAYGILDRLARAPDSSGAEGAREFFEAVARRLDEMRPALGYITRMEAPVREAARLRKLVDARDTHVHELNLAAMAREQKIQELQQALAERDGHVQALNHAVTVRDGQIHGLNHAVAGREAEGQALKLAIAARDSQLHDLSHAARDRDVQLQGMIHAMAALDGQVHGLNQALAERDARLEAFERSAALAREKTDTLAGALREVRSVVAREAALVREAAARIGATDFGAVAPPAAMPELRAELDRYATELGRMEDALHAADRDNPEGGLKEWIEHEMSARRAAWESLAGAVEELGGALARSHRELEIGRLRLVDSLRAASREGARSGQLEASLRELERVLAERDACIAQQNDEVLRRDRILGLAEHRFATRLGAVVGNVRGLVVRRGRS